MGIGLPQSDVFRPRLPLDPFDGVDLSEPWVLDPAALAVHALRLRRDVILALGGASTLHPFLASTDVPGSAEDGGAARVTHCADPRLFASPRRHARTT